MIAILAFLAPGIACGPSLQFAPPFILAEEPPGLQRLPISAAIVRPAGLIHARHRDTEDFGHTLGQALMAGLRDATKVMAARVAVVDAKDRANADLIIIPSNFYYEVDKGDQVMFSMDVTLIRAKDGKESGMLVEGSSGPGKRHIETWHRTGRKLHVMGAYLKNDRLGQALNNALFDLVFNYAKKLDRRLPGFLDQ